MNAETRIGQFPRSSATADDVANGRRSQKQKIARNGNIARRGSIGRAIKSEPSVSICSQSMAAYVARGDAGVVYSSPPLRRRVAGTRVSATLLKITTSFTGFLPGFYWFHPVFVPFNRDSSCLTVFGLRLS